jgi:hypothetical protein
VKKIKAKKIEKTLSIACNEVATIFYQNLSIRVKVGGFFGCRWGFANML